MLEVDGVVSECPQHKCGYRNTRRIGTCVGKIWTNNLVIMYPASWYLKYSKLYRCVMLKPVAFLKFGGDSK
jgi:hypothetical protein